MDPKSSALGVDMGELLGTDVFFECVEDLGVPISRPEKSRARAYLATTPDPEKSVGVAARLGHWNFDHDAFVGVRRFLGDLAAGRPAE